MTMMQDRRFTVLAKLVETRGTFKSCKIKYKYTVAL